MNEAFTRLVKQQYEVLKGAYALHSARDPFSNQASPAPAFNYCWVALLEMCVCVCEGKNRKRERERDQPKSEVSTHVPNSVHVVLKFRELTMCWRQKRRKQDLRHQHCNSKRPPLRSIPLGKMNYVILGHCVVLRSSFVLR